MYAYICINMQQLMNYMSINHISLSIYIYICILALNIKSILNMAHGI